jgi:hypothetical protein
MSTPVSSSSHGLQNQPTVCKMLKNLKKIRMHFQIFHIPCKNTNFRCSKKTIYGNFSSFLHTCHIKCFSQKLVCEHWMFIWLEPQGYKPINNPQWSCTLTLSTEWNQGENTRDPRHVHGVQGWIWEVMCGLGRGGARVALRSCAIYEVSLNSFPKHDPNLLKIIICVKTY